MKPFAIAAALVVGLACAPHGAGLALWLLAASVALAPIACGSDPKALPAGQDGGVPEGGGFDASGFDAGPVIDNDPGACTTTFSYTPAAGHLATSVSIAE